MFTSFVDKVLYYGSYDTRKYRYRVKEYPTTIVIERLPLDSLDTTDALSNWQYYKLVTGR